MSCTFLLAALFSAAVYSVPMNPREHPDDARRAVKPPSAETFGNKVHFMALRGLGSGKDWTRSLDRWVEEDKLGDILWLSKDFLKNRNLPEAVAEIKRRGYYLFDIWGYVPCHEFEFHTPREISDLFERELGDHWLGMDNGEQDGRYVAVYAPKRVPSGTGRLECYRHFQRHFEEMDRIHGNKMATLVSLTYGHYFLKESCYTMIGAETAQALPNAQIYYSFIRGAGKQYGVPWFGNVSVYNRWGFKSYTGKPPKEVDTGGHATHGTSLALMKKLMYAQIFYNSLAAGFECSFYGPDGKLSPIGKIQQDAVKWCGKNGSPGLMHAPVALVTDFYSGWTYPRHLYSHESFRVWGVLPYEPGDHLMDGVLSMLYPGYEDSGYYRDERGFNTATPYGDIADCLLSDAPLWLLKQYPVVVLANRVAPTEEFRDTLKGYLAAGGELVLTEGNQRALFPSGVSQGRVTVVPGEWGIADKARCAFPVKVEVGEPLPRPYPLTDAAKKVLDNVFRRQMIFSTSTEPKDDGLSIITCRRGKGDYTVCVLNNTWEERPFGIHAQTGKVISVEELPIPCDERAAEGFAPRTLTNLVAGADSPTRIAAGAVRTFRVKTDEGGAVKELPPSPPTPNAGHFLALRDITSIRDEILKRPTFFRHCSGVVVEGEYVLSHDVKALAREANWTKLQGLEVAVDMSALFNGFPDLRFYHTNAVENARLEETFADLFAKMPVMGAKDVFVATDQVAWRVPYAAYTNTAAYLLKNICRSAAKTGIKVHMRQIPGETLTSGVSQLHMWEKTVGEPNFRSAPSLAAFMHQEKGVVKQIAAVLGFTVNEKEYTHCDYFFLSVPRADPETKILISERDPVATQTFYPDISPVLKELGKKKVRYVYDAVYPDADSEYRDMRLFESLRAP